MHVALPLCPGSLPVVGTACSAVSGAAGKAVGFGVDAVFAAAGRWVASGAVWLLGQVGSAMSASTAVDLGSGWFASHEAVMASLAAAVVLPMACCAAIQAVYHQSPSMLVRTFLVYLPLSLLLTGVAVELVRLGLAVTDALSNRVLAGSGVDTTNLLGPVSTFFAGVGAVEPAVPAFVVFVGGILVALAALVLWLELVVRAAAISAAALFLPLALTSLVWPAVAHWCRRLADTLAALVLSKLVIAAVLSLAAAALAGGLGQSGASSGGGFSAVVVGIALLAVATLAPFTLLRLVPAIEQGAVAHLEGTRHRLQAAAGAPVRTGSLALGFVQTASTPSSAAAGELGTGAGAEGLGSRAPSIGMVTGEHDVGESPGPVGAGRGRIDGRSATVSSTPTSTSESDGADRPTRSVGPPMQPTDPPTRSAGGREGRSRGRSQPPVDDPPPVSGDAPE